MLSKNAVFTVLFLLSVQSSWITSADNESAKWDALINSAPDVQKNWKDRFKDVLFQKKYYSYEPDQTKGETFEPFTTARYEPRKGQVPGRKDAYDSVNAGIAKWDAKIQNLSQKYRDIVRDYDVKGGSARKPSQDLAMISHEIKNAQFKRGQLEQAKRNLQSGQETHKALQPVREKYLYPASYGAGFSETHPEPKDIKQSLRGQSERSPYSYLPRTQPTFWERLKTGYYNYVGRMRAPEEEARFRGENVPYRTGAWQRRVPAFVPRWTTPAYQNYIAPELNEMQQRGLLWGN